MEHWNIRQGLAAKISNVLITSAMTRRLAIGVSAGPNKIGGGYVRSLSRGVLWVGADAVPPDFFGHGGPVGGSMAARSGWIAVDGVQAGRNVRLMQNQWLSAMAGVAVSRSPSHGLPESRRNARFLGVRRQIAPLTTRRGSRIGMGGVVAASLWLAEGAFPLSATRPLSYAPRVRAGRVPENLSGQSAHHRLIAGSGSARYSSRRRMGSGVWEAPRTPPERVRRREKSLVATGWGAASGLSAKSAAKAGTLESGVRGVNRTL